MRGIEKRVKNVKVAQKSLEAIQSEKRRLKDRLDNETLSDETEETIHQQIDKLAIQERKMKKKYKKKRSAWDRYKYIIGAGVATAGVAYLAKDINFHDQITSAVASVKANTGIDLEEVWGAGTDMAKNAVCNKLPVQTFGVDVCAKVPGCIVSPPTDPMGVRCVRDTYNPAEAQAESQAAEKKRIDWNKRRTAATAKARAEASRRLDAKATKLGRVEDEFGPEEADPDTKSTGLTSLFKWLGTIDTLGWHAHHPYKESMKIRGALTPALIEQYGKTFLQKMQNTYVKQQEPREMWQDLIDRAGYFSKIQKEAKDNQLMVYDNSRLMADAVFKAFENYGLGSGAELAVLTVNDRQTALKDFNPPLWKPGLPLITKTLIEG